MWSTGRPPPCAWPPTRCCAARPTLAPNTVVCEPDWEPRRPSLHGPSARPTRLSNVEVRSTICRQRSRELRTAVSQPTDPVFTQESSPTRFPVNGSFSGGELSFWRGNTTSEIRETEGVQISLLQSQPVQIILMRVVKQKEVSGNFSLCCDIKES